MYPTKDVHQGKLTDDQWAKFSELFCIGYPGQERLAKDGNKKSQNYKSTVLAGYKMALYAIAHEPVPQRESFETMISHYRETLDDKENIELWNTDRNIALGELYAFLEFIKEKGVKEISLDA